MTEAARSAKGSETSLKRPTNRAEFLAKCPALAASFFTRLLERATERGYVVGWGGVGFSVRANVSFLYGWPDGRFDFYADYLLRRGILPREQEPEFRKKLLGFGVFKESGEFTLRTNVDAKTAPALPELCEAIFDKIDELLKAARPANETEGDAP